MRGRSRNAVTMASVLLLSLLANAACGSQPEDVETYGLNPDLADPEDSLLPTLNIAKAVGWAPGEMPSAREGLEVAAFASELDHPRWLHVLPNGDVLVAESQAPPKRAGGFFRNWIEKKVMQRAGAGTRPSADRITLLRDTDGDGAADFRSVYLDGLYSPMGMAVIGEHFYVANADAILRFDYVEGADQLTRVGRRWVELPGGPINHHWTKTLLASADGKRLYAAVGSNSNIAERGMEVEQGRAAIWEIDVETGEHRIFASGLRNPVGMAWESTSGNLWTVVNERDELGDNLVPDYLTSVKDGAFYGWPWSYFGKHIDTRVEPANPVMASKAIRPDFAVGAHTASLGLAHSKGNALGAEYSEGMFVAQHGSWNRSSPSGYKVIFVPFVEGKPIERWVEVLGAFLSGDGEARGRPVGLAIDGQGALLVADDVGNTIWRVRASTKHELAKP